ncbi:unnamed protein product, partial [Pocillopora meandrina]
QHTVLTTPSSVLSFRGNLKTTPIRLRKSNDRMVALVYGKDPEFWRDHADYIDTMKKHFRQVHATLGGTSKTQRKNDVPEYVIDHVKLNYTSFFNLL